MPKRRNSAIKKYKIKAGTRFMFQIYVGINEQTGKQQMTTRRGFLSYEEADSAYNQIQIQVENGQYQTQKQRETSTFTDVYNLWWKDYLNEVKPSTANKTEEWIVNHILPEFGSLKIDKITPAICQKAVNQWAKDFVRYKTLCNYAKRIFHFSMVLGLRQTNPMDQIIIPKKGRQSNRDAKNNYWDNDQFKLFLRLLTKRPLEQQVVFRLLAFTGMRRGELLALQWRDIDFDKQELHITKTLAMNREKQIIVQSPKTKAGVRTIPIENKTFAMLKDWHSEQRKFLNLGRQYKINQLVVTTQDNHPLPFPQIGHWLDQIINEYNDTQKPQTYLKRITTHGFRHTFATLMYGSDNSITPKDLQKLMGHDTMQVTMDIYTHATKKGQEKLADAINKLDL